MRRIWNEAVIGCGVALITWIAAPASAQNGFTGTITYETHSDNGSSGTFIETQRGNKTRIEYKDADTTTGRGGAMIIDRDAKTRTIIMHKEKMYMTTPMMPAGMMPRSRTSEATTTFTNTGKTKTVAGVTCEVYHGTTIRNGKTEEGDACIAKGVGLNPLDFMGMGGPRGGANLPPELAALSDILKDGGGVLEVITYKTSQPLVAFRVKSIDRTPPPDVAFAPPSEYQAFQMPKGMGGMPGGMPGMGPPGGQKSKSDQ